MPEGFLFLGGFLVLGEEYSRLLVVFLNLFSHRSDRGCSSNKCNRILLKKKSVKWNFKKNLHGGIEIRFNNLVGSIYYIGGVFMKKLLGVLLAVVMSWPVGATVLNNVEVKGEIQTIASDVHHNNVDPLVADPYNSGASGRVLAGLSAELVEDVTANLMFQYAHAWGDNVSNEGKSVQDYWDNVKLVNANVVLHNLFCAFDLTVGRQFYGDEDSAVMYIGPNHYNAEWNGYVNSIDAAKLVYSDDVKTFTMIAGTINDMNAWSRDMQDVLPLMDIKYNLYGADFRMNVTDNLTAQVYGYDIVAHGEDVDPDEDQHSGFYGAKVGMNVEAVRASVEYARNFGGHRLVKEHHDTGYMVKADVAADIEKVTARGTFLYAKSGNEEGEFWAMGNYTPGLLVGHLIGGDGIWDYSNNGVRLFNVGVDFKPFEKWVFSLDGYTFQSRTGHATTYEADLTAKYNHNEYVQLFAGFGYAKYTKNEKYGTEYSRDNRNDPDNFKGQIGMLIKF